MKKNNIKKLALLSAVVCGIQVICVSTSKGEEAKAGFLSGARSALSNLLRRGGSSASRVSNVSTTSTVNTSAYRKTNYYKQGDRSKIRVLNTAANQKNSIIPLQDGSDGLFQIKKSSGGVEHRVKINSGGVYTESYKDGKMILKSNREGNKLTTEWISGNGNLVTKREVRDGSSITTTTFDNLGKQLSSKTINR